MPPVPSVLRWGLAACVLLHFFLAVAFATVTPYLQPGRSNEQALPDIGAPDEFAHIHFVDHLARHRDLPVLHPGQPSAITGYESHQPPLYYAITALVSPNPLAPESALRTRLPNSLFGALNVLGAFFFVLWATRRPRLSLLCSAIVAFLPMNVALSGAASNDPLALAIATWTLALLARFKDGWTLARAAGIGALVGVGILTKANGLLLIPTVVLALWPSDDRWRLSAVSVAVTALVSGWWFVRNQVVYGHALTLNAFYATFPRQVWPAQVFSGLRPFAHWGYVLGAGTLLSFVGVFGYMDIHLPYALYIPILAVSGIGLLLGLRQWRAPLHVLVFVGLLAASYVSYNLWQIQPQARYLFPALAPITLWIASGIAKLGPKRSVPVAALLVGLLLSADAYALATLPAAYAERTANKNGAPITSAPRSERP